MEDCGRQTLSFLKWHSLTIYHPAIIKQTHQTKRKLLTIAVGEKNNPPASTRPTVFLFHQSFDKKYSIQKGVLLIDRNKDVRGNDLGAYNIPCRVTDLQDNKSYDWFITNSENCHGTSTLKYDDSKLYSIISENHFNSIPPKYHCSECKTYEADLGSYISYIKEDDFLLDPNKYIEKAYEKSNRLSDFKLKKQK